MLKKIKNHFYLIEQTNITKYAVENYVNIMNEKDCNYIIKKQKGYYKRDTKRCTDSYEIVKSLVNSTDYNNIVQDIINSSGLKCVTDLITAFLGTNNSLLTPLNHENTNLAATPFYDKVEPCFDSLGYNNDCIRPVKSEPKESQAVNVFFDFETDTSGEPHVPNGVNFKYNNTNYWFEAVNC